MLGENPNLCRFINLIKKSMNHFEYRGSSICGEKRQILENATAWDDEIEITRFEKMSDGSFVSENYNSSSCFIWDSKLFYFIFGRISIQSFFELNQLKEKCVNGNFGAYFQFKQKNQSD